MTSTLRGPPVDDLERALNARWRLLEAEQSGAIEGELVRLTRLYEKALAKLTEEQVAAIAELEVWS